MVYRLGVSGVYTGTGLNTWSTDSAWVGSTQVRVSIHGLPTRREWGLHRYGSQYMVYRLGVSGVYTGTGLNPWSTDSAWVGSTQVRVSIHGLPTRREWGLHRYGSQYMVYRLGVSGVYTGTGLNPWSTDSAWVGSTQVRASIHGLPTRREWGLHRYGSRAEKVWER